LTSVSCRSKHYKHQVKSVTCEVVSSQQKCPTTFLPLMARMDGCVSSVSWRQGAATQILFSCSGQSTGWPNEGTPAGHFPPIGSCDTSESGCLIQHSACGREDAPVGQALFAAARFLPTAPARMIGARQSEKMTETDFSVSRLLLSRRRGSWFLPLNFRLRLQQKEMAPWSLCRGRS
jgi:hypothetical protein